MASAAVDGASDAVKKTQTHAVPLGDLPQGFLSPEESKVGGEIPAVLDRVGVTEHHFLKVPSRAEQDAVERIGEEPVENAGAGVEIVISLKERDDIEARHQPPGSERAGAARTRLHQTCLAPQQQHVPDVGAARGHA